MTVGIYQIVNTRLSDETKQKISAAMAGKKRTPRPPEIREKIRAALLLHFNLSALRRDNNNAA